jgi:hypothetical protein
MEKPETKNAEPGGPGISEGSPDLVLIDICRDIISIPFEVWAILKPAVKPLSETEKDLIAKPLSRIAVKYDLAKFMKDEILLFGFLGYSVLKRIKVSDHAGDNSRKEGKGKDNLSEKADIATGNPSPIEQPETMPGKI